MQRLIRELAERLRNELPGIQEDTLRRNLRTLQEDLRHEATSRSTDPAAAAAAAARMEHVVHLRQELVDYAERIQALRAALGGAARDAGGAASVVEQRDAAAVQAASTPGGAAAAQAVPVLVAAAGGAAAADTAPADAGLTLSAALRVQAAAENDDMPPSAAVRRVRQWGARLRARECGAL